MMFDIQEIIISQLPRTVVAALNLTEIRSDSYHLSADARFVLSSGRDLVCTLEPMDVGNGRKIAGKVPDEIIARLCLMV